jgi:hypothetical protein
MTPARIAQLRDALSSMRGSGVLLWKYTASHTQLTLRLHQPNVKGNVHIICDGCVYLCGPPGWSDQRLSFEERTSDGDVQYVLADERAGFRVICGHIRVDTDVPPLY